MTTNAIPYPTQLLRTPRRGRWEFPLHFLTFLIYSCFWLCARVSELNRFTSHKFISGLWFFVPLLPIVQPFAFYLLNQELSKLELQYNVAYKRSHYYLAVTVIFVCSVYFGVDTEHEWDTWLTGLSLLFCSIAFTVINSRINMLKIALNDVEFKGKDNGYSAFEWALIIGLASSIIAMVVLIKFPSLLTDINSPTANHIQTYNDKDIFKHPTIDYQLTFSGDNWQQVTLGSVSDGTAEYEFLSSLDEGYFVIFKSKNNKTINELVDSRWEWIEENIDSPSCSETRSFIADSSFVKTTVVCTGIANESHQWAAVTLIEGSEYTYELLGTFQAPKDSYEQWAQRFNLMAAGFTYEN